LEHAAQRFSVPRGDFVQLRTLEPLVPIYRFQTAAQLYFNGRNQAAIALLETTPDDSPARFYRDLYLARAYAASGRFADSANSRQRGWPDLCSPQGDTDFACD
jgi:hypothetical protein